MTAYHAAQAPSDAQSLTDGLRRPNGRPITVLQVLPSLVAGGAERGAVDVAVAIQQAGGRAIVASEGGPMVRELERAGALHVTLPLRGKHPLRIRRNARLLASLIRSQGVDIVHARSRAPAWSALRAAEKTGARFVTTFHAAYNFESDLKKRYNSVMAMGERVIAISDFIAEHIIQHYAPDTAKIRIIPRGVDLAVFDPDRVANYRKMQIARDWRLPDESPLLLMPARLTRLKGHLVLIDALAELGRTDICCIMVGAETKKSGYRREVETAIARRRLSGLVRLVDHVTDMPAAYTLANTVIAPSLVPEGFGRIAIEAQAMGRPIVATDMGGYRESILDGRTGLLVPAADPRALAEAIAGTLSLSPEERSGLAHYARQHVARHFSKEGMCQATLSVYRELVEGR